MQEPQDGVVSVVIPAGRLVDRSGAHKVKALQELADDLSAPDTFRRMTAYTIVKTLLEEIGAVLNAVAEPYRFQ